jgi:ethanolamine utilization protein EutQ (cupin superfamily)
VPDCWPILPAPASGWPQLAMGVWELRASRWGDCHPHDEVNYVLAGTLIVECGGLTIEGRPGDTIRVPAGLPASYHAPEYARMLYVYGPNPEGRPSTTFGGGSERR